jgi:transcriptional regulator with XRE-family HTH domain
MSASASTKGSIRDRRQAAGFSQQELAKRADCSISTVRIAEHGWQLSEAMRERLAAVLDCDPEDLT